MSQVVKIKLDSIIPNKSQPRLDFYDETIEGLAESIKETACCSRYRSVNRETSMS